MPSLAHHCVPRASQSMLDNLSDDQVYQHDWHWRMSRNPKDGNVHIQTCYNKTQTWVNINKPADWRWNLRHLKACLGWLRNVLKERDDNDLLTP